jgi:hypothetical protein
MGKCVTMMKNTVIVELVENEKNWKKKVMR